nr:MAG TPA: hypothetical protein [Caudoviricetes sp.]
MLFFLISILSHLASPTINFALPSDQFIQKLF